MDSKIHVKVNTEDGPEREFLVSLRDGDLVIGGRKAWEFCCSQPGKIAFMMLTVGDSGGTIPLSCNDWMRLVEEGRAIEFFRGVIKQRVIGRAHIDLDLGDDYQVTLSGKGIKSTLDDGSGSQYSAAMKAVEMLVYAQFSEGINVGGRAYRDALMATLLQIEKRVPKDSLSLLAELRDMLKEHIALKQQLEYGASQELELMEELDDIFPEECVRGEDICFAM